MPISACIIAKDEQANIGPCIQSLQGLVDQVVVVDTGSTDATVSIAEELGADVYSIPFTGDFALARNYSLDKAVHDWVLVIDADERVAKEDHHLVSSLISRVGVDGYRILIRNYTPDASVQGWMPNDGRYSEYAHLPGFFPFNLVRLFKRSSGIRYEGIVHETNERSLVGKRIRQSCLVIHHLGRLTRSQTREKDKLYLELGEKKISENCDDARAYYELAKQWALERNWEKALELLETALRLDHGDPDILFNYALCLHNRGRATEAVDYYQKVLQMEPDHFGALVNAGCLMRQMGKTEESRRLLKSAIAQAPHHPAPLHHLGILEMECGNLEQAVEYLLGALERNPSDPSHLVPLAKCYALLGRLREAQLLLDTVKNSSRA